MNLRMIGQEWDSEVGAYTTVDIETASPLSLNTWHQVMISASVWESEVDLLIDGTPNLQTNVLTTDLLDFPYHAVTIGADKDGLNLLSADLAQLWFFLPNAPFDHPNFSDQSFINYFRGTDGKPRELGNFGKSPLQDGNTVNIFFTGNAATWNTGVNQTDERESYTPSPFTVFGTLTDAATSPSD